MNPNLKKHERKRTWIQLLATALTNGYAIGFSSGKIFQGSGKLFCVPGLNCYSCPGALGACPIGSLQAVLGSHKYHFSFYVLGWMMLFGIVLGRVVCGFLCPFGLVQDLLHRIPVPKITVPVRIDRVLRYLKYAILGIVVILLPISLTNEFGIAPPYFCKYICPVGILEGAFPLMLTNPGLRQAAGALFQWKTLVLILIVVGSTLIHRPFCKYLCPLGAFYGLFARYSFYQMKVDSQHCTHCNACVKACPMQVNVPEKINSSECIRCGRCKQVCPTNCISSGFSSFEKSSKTQTKADSDSQ